MSEYSVPQWLQKELDQFGLFSSEDYGDKPVDKIKCKYPQPSGWKPSYVDEQPPF